MRTLENRWILLGNDRYDLESLLGKEDNIAMVTGGDAEAMSDHVTSEVAVSGIVRMRRTRQRVR